MSEQHYFEVSGRFAEAVMARIERLEREASEDANLIPQVTSEDQQRRIACLVAAQMEEALRLRHIGTFSGVTVQAIREALTRGGN